MSFFVISFFVILADQLSKFFVIKNMIPYQSISIIDDFLSLTYVRNSGAAFGILEGKSWFFIIITLLFIIVALSYYHKMIKEMTIEKIGIVLSVGGAIGNLIDRIRFGEVIDFIDVNYFSVFNLADCAICVGVFLIVLAILFKNDKKEEEI